MKPAPFRAHRLGQMERGVWAVGALSAFVVLMDTRFSLSPPDLTPYLLVTGGISAAGALWLAWRVRAGGVAPRGGES